MPMTTTKEQEQWAEIVNNPLLRNLPYKVETNARGQILLSPHKAHHARQQKALITHLDDCRPDGEAFPEYPIATAKGVKQADVIWASRDRLQEMQETGDPPTLAPEICVEVLSDSNTVDELDEKRALYREAGAEEVWVVEQDGQIRFFADEERSQSAILPDAPNHL